MDPVDPSLAPW
nr:tat protein [Human immunodeficiency virus 1]